MCLYKSLNRSTCEYILSIICRSLLVNLLHETPKKKPYNFKVISVTRYTLLFGNVNLNALNNIVTILSIVPDFCGGGNSQASKLKNTNKNTHKQQCHQGAF